MKPLLRHISLLSIIPLLTSCNSLKTISYDDFVSFANKNYSLTNVLNTYEYAYLVQIMTYEEFYTETDEAFFEPSTVKYIYYPAGFQYLMIDDYIKEQYEYYGDSLVISKNNKGTKYTLKVNSFKTIYTYGEYIYIFYESFTSNISLYEDGNISSIQSKIKVTLEDELYYSMTADAFIEWIEP